MNSESSGVEYCNLGVSIDHLLVENPYATFMGVANGDSMNDVGIYSGDLLIIDRSIRANHMDVVVATYNGNFCCKLFDEKNKRLISASDDFPAIDICNVDSFFIEGVVTRSIRCHRPSPLLNT